MASTPEFCEDFSYDSDESYATWDSQIYEDSYCFEGFPDEYDDELNWWPIEPKSRSLHNNMKRNKKWKNRHKNYRYYCMECDMPKKRNPYKECTFGVCGFGNLSKRRNRKVYAIKECREAMKAFH